METIVAKTIGWLGSEPAHRNLGPWLGKGWCCKMLGGCGDNRLGAHCESNVTDRCIVHLAIVFRRGITGHRPAVAWFDSRLGLSHPNRIFHEFPSIFMVERWRFCFAVPPSRIEISCGPEIDRPDWRSSWYYSVLLGKYQNISLKLGHDHFPFIIHYIAAIWTTESVFKQTIANNFSGYITITVSFYWW